MCGDRSPGSTHGTPRARRQDRYHEAPLDAAVALFAEQGARDDSAGIAAAGVTPARSTTTAAASACSMP
jgi:hypothetical protein